MSDNWLSVNRVLDIRISDNRVSVDCDYPIKENFLYLKNSGPVVILVQNCFRFYSGSMLCGAGALHYIVTLQLTVLPCNREKLWKWFLYILFETWICYSINCFF